MHRRAKRDAIRRPRRAARRRQDVSLRHVGARRARSRRARRRIPVAARPVGLRQIDSVAHHRRLERANAGAVEWPAAAGGRERKPDRLRVPGADADAVGQRIQQCLLPLKLKGVRGAKAAHGPRPRARPRRLAGIRPRLSARIVGRHAHARLDRARAGHRAGAAVDGRAVRRARRDHALQAQQRSAAGLAGAAHHGGIRHPFGLRVGLSVEPHRGDGGAAGPRLHRAYDRRALSARPRFPHLGRLCGALPPHVGSAGASHGGGRRAHEAAQQLSARERRDRVLRIALPIVVLALGLALWELVVRIETSRPMCCRRPPHRADAGHRLGSTVPFAPRHACNHSRGLFARGGRRRRACGAVQSIAAGRIFALSLCRDPAGDADRRRRAAAC